MFPFDDVIILRVTGRTEGLTMTSSSAFIHGWGTFFLPTSFNFNPYLDT